MAALRRSCLGMQEERDRESKSKRQERRWWWENEKLKCALPLGDLYKWPQIEGMLFGIHTDFSTEQRTFYSSFPLSWWGCTPRKRGMGRGGVRVWRSGGVITQHGAEGREPDGYFILSIEVCKWKCQSGRKTNESDRRDATSLTKRLINCHCLFWALYICCLLFFDCFLCRPRLFCG